MAERKLKVALIGAGFGKTTQMPGFRDSPAVEVVAVCSGHLARAEALAREFGVAMLCAGSVSTTLSRWFVIPSRVAARNLYTAKFCISRCRDFSVLYR